MKQYFIKAWYSDGDCVTDEVWSNHVRYTFNYAYNDVCSHERYYNCVCIKLVIYCDGERVIDISF